MPAPIAADFDDEYLAGGVVVDWGEVEAEVVLGVWLDDDAGGEDDAV